MKKDNTLGVLTKFISLLNLSIEDQVIETELLMHPEYPSLLAISDVLMNLNIITEAFHADQDDLINIQSPFIIHTSINSGDFIIVHRIANETAYVSSEIWNKHKLSLTELKKINKGIVLTAKTKENFSLMRYFETLLFNFKLPITITCVFVILIMTLIFHTDYLASLNWQIILLTFLKSAGLITTILLLVQSIDRDNPLIQKLCKSGEKTDCDAILSSNASKVFKGLTWSEVGFFYFSGTWLLVLFSGGQIAILQSLIILNFVSLPYTIYSIYYQMRVAKQLCVLCCTVQGLLWLEFIPLIKTGSIYLNGNWGANTWSILFIALLLPVATWILLKPILVKAQQLSTLKQQLQKFKYNSESFKDKLLANVKFTQPSEEWSIVLGNAKSENIITIITNPYCNPCAKTHKLLDELIKQNPNLQARIIFTANNTDDDIKTPISRHLMSLYNLPNKSIINKALHDWYKQKHKDYNTWAKEYPTKLTETEYSKLDKQLAWCQTTGVTTTPTVLINGHLLPDLYQLSDLKYMLE